MINQTISHYTVTEYIGAGGLGLVYKAQDFHLNRDVAIKFLPQLLSEDETTREQFLHGARAASALDHPNICPVYDFDHTNSGQMYMVMAYCEGQTLQHIIEKAHKDENSGLSINQSIDILLQIARGLRAAHENGIVHRDIKPANIVVNEAGEVKILDFGLAQLNKVMQQSPETPSGTLLYMSPEHAMGEATDHRSDIWSLGVVLYELITGTLPFKGEFDQSILYSIMREEFQSLHHFNENVPQQLDAIVQKLLTRNVEQRYNTVEEVLHDLEILHEPKRQAVESAKRSTKKWRLVAQFTVFLLMSFFLTLNLWYPGKETPKKTVAVLPFTSTENQDQYKYFNIGFAEDIRKKLSTIGNLLVHSRTAVMPYANEQPNPVTVANALGTQAVLMGSVQRTGNWVQVDAQLFSEAGKKQIWSETYAGEVSDVFGIQSAIVQNIARHLNTNLTIDEENRTRKVPTQNITAYEHYLQAQTAGVEFAIKQYKQALELDPDFAPAWAELGEAYVKRGSRPRIYSDAWLDSAIVMANRARTLDSTSSAAFNTLGLAYYYKNQFQKAFDAYKKVLDLTPNNDTALFRMGSIYQKIAEYEEALIFFKSALYMTPKSRRITEAIGNVYFSMKNYDAALHWFQRLKELHPISGYLNTALVYMETGQYELADGIYEELIRQAPGNEYRYHDPAIIYQNQGKQEKAMALMKKALAINPRNAWHYVGLAGFYIEQGNLDAALDLYKEGTEQVPAFLYMNLAYSFLLQQTGNTEKARLVLGTPVNAPENWIQVVIKFYLGELSEQELEKALQYSFIKVRDEKVFDLTMSHYLGMAYLYNMSSTISQKAHYTAKAVDYLKMYLEHAHKDGVERAVARAELRRLGEML